MVVKLQTKRVMPLCVCLFFLVLPSFGQVQAPPVQNKPAPAASEVEKDRGQILKEIAAAQEALLKDPSHSEVRSRLARLLYQSGEFEKAKTSALPLLDAAKPTNETLFLAADLDYLLGHYDKAESAYQKIIALNPGDLQVQARADSKLAMTYYQTNQYAKAADLFKELEGKIKLPHWDLMRAFGRERPYQIVWPGDFGLSIAPFIVTDPLPIVSVEIQGRQIYALIDTGADLFMLDTEVAAALGIKPLASMTGTFAGGKQAEVGFGRVNSLRIGQVTLKAVPISILPTQRFSKGFAEGKYTIGGIVGTGVLKQFLATMDYPGEQLVLRRADEEGRKDLRQATEGKTVVEVPFVLAVTHFLMARGSLDGKEGLTFFVDSGLAGEAAFAAPVQTLKYAGIPIPETKVEDGIGGGGGGFATGLFKIARLGLGPLVQENLKGEYGANPPESYWRLGFINDGIISHQFLRKHAWTIDFAGMRMILAK